LDINLLWGTFQRLSQSHYILESYAGLGVFYAPECFEAPGAYFRTRPLLQLLDRLSTNVDMTCSIKRPCTWFFSL